MRAVIHLPAHPRSTRDARAFVRETLRDWRLDAVAGEAELLASELVTNVVLHAGTEFDVVVIHESHAPVRVEVRDGSRRAPRRRRYSEEASTGRGLMLVESLASRHGVDVDGQGKLVWFELDVPERAMANGQEAS